MNFPSIFPVTAHTHFVGKGTTFVAIKGMKENGIHYISQALEKGASTIVVEKAQDIPQDIVEKVRENKAELHYVENSRLALAQLSAQALDFPAKKLKFIGVTGTKGKTSTTFLIEHILKSAGIKTALVSTVKNRIGDDELPASLTTPQPDYLHVFFNECVRAGVEYVVMEVAAQAVTLHRVYDIEFDVLVFTNFSQEHGEFYATQNEYFAAKAQLLDQLKATGIFIANADDEKVKTLSFHTKVSYGLRSSDAMIKAEIFENTLKGLQIRVFSHDFSYSLTCPSLVGEFNAYNMLAAVTSVRKVRNVSKEIIQTALATFPGVPGRLNRFVLPKGAIAFIDYAHNPSSYQAVFSALRPYTEHLIVVFGGGGERDQLKRPLMGKLAVEYADVVILTSDNPRSEDPHIIIEHIKAGIPQQYQHKVFVELDREKAIRCAYEKSWAYSTILLLGKGPDEYQIINGTKYPFSEVNILKSLL